MTPAEIRLTDAMVAETASNLRCQKAEQNYRAAEQERDVAHAAWKRANTEFFEARKIVRRENDDTRRETSRVAKTC